MGRSPRRKNKSRKSFSIPDPKIEDAVTTSSKYKLGKKGVSFHSIKNLYPRFAFDYLSLNGSNLCFNKNSNTKKDLIGFLEGLKKISGYTYERMGQEQPIRFHHIDFLDRRVAIKPKDFLKVLAPSNRGMTEDELPTLYQFDIQYRIEARIVGFLYKGIFYLVWYDRDHKIYPKK